MDNRNDTSKFTEKKVNKNNKVVDLNSTRVRHMKLRMELNEKKSILTASILSIVAVVTFINQKIVSQNDTKLDGRTIASIDLNEQAKYRFEWQKDLANKLATTGSRMPASLGEQPDKIDKIRFGLLEGKYTFKFDNNKIKEIEFAETFGGDRPKHIKLDQFFRENKELFDSQASDIVASKKDTLDNKKEEVFELRDSDSNVISRVHAVTDTYGRLLSVKVSQ